MAKHKKQRDNKLPENNKNNFAYYKKKIDQTLQNEEKNDWAEPSLKSTTVILTQTPSSSNTKKKQDCN